MPRRFNSRNKSRDGLSSHKGGFNSTPKGDKTVDYLISSIAMRNLPYSSYAMKIDPIDEANQSARKYPLLTSFNKKFNAKYAGADNINGGNLSQYANSINSGFLNCYDSMYLFLKANYRYLPIDPGEKQTKRGKRLVDMMRQSIAEAVSQLDSSTFVDQSFYDYAVVTDMPMGSAVPTVIDGQNVYTNITDTIYATSIMYQIYLQELVVMFGAFNKMRVNQSTMLDMSYDRETPVLNDLFGLYNKRAFLSKVDSIADVVPGEYFDYGWAKQMGTFSNIVSRRSNAMSDPLLEIGGVLHTPRNFKLVLMNADKSEIIATVWELDGTAYEGSVIGNSASYPNGLAFTKLVENWVHLLSIEDTLRWARDLNYLNEAAGVQLNSNIRYNTLNDIIGAVVSDATKFKTSMNDFRTVLDVLYRTGIVTWSKGFRPRVLPDTSCNVVDYQLVDDIYKFCLGGSSTAKFNNVTKRWRTWTMWNMYEGVPTYTMQNGGSFLTFSLKTLDITEDDDNNVEYLPILFSTAALDEYKVVHAVNRLGDERIIRRTTVNLASNKNFARLVPLKSQSEHSQFVPNVTSDDDNPLTNYQASHLVKAMLTVFGVASITIGQDTDYDIDPDYFAVFDYEITDSTNEAISYARANAPFRGTHDTGASFGFIGNSSGK